MDQLYRQPWLGASWEGFVIEQTLATLTATGHRNPSFFLRSSDGYELDLILDRGGEYWAIEIKLTSNPSAREIDRLQKTADMIDARQRVLICRIAQKIENHSLLICSLQEWLQRIAE